MKPLLSLFIVFALCGSVQASDGSLQDSIDAANYPLRQVLRPHVTYAGVIADSSIVTVRFGPRGLVPALTFGVGNALFGTHIGASTTPAVQYVVRLDQPYPGCPAEIVTVIQRESSGVPWAPGTPCFIVTWSDEACTRFSARIVAAKTPQAYAVQGMEETRIQSRAR